MAAFSTTHLISYSEEIIDGQPICVSSNCSPIKALNFEPAGHAFHSAALRLFGVLEDEDVDYEKNNTTSDKDQSYTQSSASYSTKGKKKSDSELKQQDHYALLGLGHLRYLATEDQIRRRYRVAALRHHHGNQASLLLAEETEAAKQAKKDEIENHFKAIQDAYEVLIDPARRRIYDSSDEFDDEIPTDCAPQDFFKVFGPAFLRNGRWSVNQPVPSLGDETTSLKEVDNFYNFWYSFKSWREFPHADEFDLEQAKSRDHRRWMERQNAKLSEKARKEESVRIRALVDNAYKRDLRILRRKEEEKAEKQRKKEAKFLAKKLQEEEAARIAEEEDKKAAEAALHQKKVREKEKKLLRKERTRLRSLLAHTLSQQSLDLAEEDVEKLCMSLDMEHLRNLCDKIEGTEEAERVKIRKDALGRSHNSKDEKEDVRSPPQNGALEANGQVALGTREKKEKPWSKEEIELLRKGVQKYPKGTSRRWQVISEYIGTGRSVEEILKATKTVLLQKPDSAEAALHQKKARGKERKLLRKERTRLRSLFADILSQHLLDFTEEDVEKLCMSLDMARLRNLCNKIEGSEEVERVKIIKDALGRSHNSKDEKKDARSPPQNGALEANGQIALGTREKKEKPWSKEEIELLRKGVQKYPKGTSRRWEVISEYIGTGRSVEEILKATKTVLLQKPDSAKAFDSFLEKRKPAPSIASPLTTREEVEGVTKSNAPERHPGKTDNLHDSSIQTANQQNSDVVINENGVSSSGDQDLWSAVQERALVQALKTFPKETNQRWERVAAAVPGKTVVQCKKKFALLKENFRNKKSAV